MRTGPVPWLGTGLAAAGTRPVVLSLLLWFAASSVQGAGRCCVGCGAAGGFLLPHMPTLRRCLPCSVGGEGGVVGVALGVTGVVGVPVAVGQRVALREALDQVGVGDEGFGEGDRVDGPVVEDLVAEGLGEAEVGDDVALVVGAVAGEE